MLMLIIQWSYGQSAYLRDLAQTNIKKYIDERLPEDKHLTMKHLIDKPPRYKVENMLIYTKISAVYFSSTVIIISLLVVMPLFATMHLEVQA